MGMKEMGAQLLLERRLKGWTHKDVVDKSGVSQPTLTNIEHGRPVRLSSLMKVASLYGLDLTLERKRENHADNSGRSEGSV